MPATGVTDPGPDAGEAACKAGHRPAGGTCVHASVLTSASGRVWSRRVLELFAQSFRWSILAVVLFLPTDVVLDRLDVTLANGDRGVSALPMKLVVSVRRVMLVPTKSSASLEPLSDVADRDILVHREKHVCVIPRRVYGEACHP